MRGSCWLIAITLCACGSKDSGSPPVEHRDPQVGSGDHVLAQPPRDLPKQESFKLLDAGSGEVVALRYALGGDTTTTVTMALAQVGTIETKFVTAANGVGAIRIRPGAGTADSDAGRAYLGPWHAVENRVATATFDDRGELGRIGFADDPTGKASQDAIDDVTQRLLALVVPLPVEPVGVGAQWRVVTALVQAPVVVKQTATYTLVDAHTIKVDIRRVGEEQEIPGGIDVIAAVRTYTGTVRLALDRALPAGGSLAVASTMHLRSAQAGDQIITDQGAVTLSSSPP
jgi:hypothetical protein